MIDLAPQALWGRPVVVGGGLAGSIAMLSLAPRPAVLVDPAPPGLQAASRWAQGGIAACVGADDSAERQAADTVAAGAGLSEPDAATRITAGGPDAVALLERYGVRFDRDPDGQFALGLEAAHSRRRVLHVRDTTGAAIVAALAARLAEAPSVTVLNAVMLRVVVEDGGIAGVLLRTQSGLMLLPTRAVILATGGAGSLWRSSTNPPEARGAGLVLAARAGAALRDLEFMQFHPTALAVGGDPMPLVSEAVRGEGALLIDSHGNRFMAEVAGKELAARDIVARAVFRVWVEGGQAALDVRHWPVERFAERFPAIHRVLAAHGLDPARDPLPVRPAAHYHMGGVEVGPTGRTAVDGVWACGEVAWTGFHGANRLASNSLLEAVVCGRSAAEDVAGALQPAAGPPSTAGLFGPAPDDPVIIQAIREIMDRDVGVVRDASGLAEAIDRLSDLRLRAGQGGAADAAALSILIARAALARRESRGAHYRADAGPTEPPRHSQSRWTDLD